MPCCRHGCSMQPIQCVAGKHAVVDGTTQHRGCMEGVQAMQLLLFIAQALVLSTYSSAWPWVRPGVQ